MTSAPPEDVLESDDSALSDAEQVLKNEATVGENVRPVDGAMKFEAADEDEEDAGGASADYRKLLLALQMEGNRSKSSAKMLMSFPVKELYPEAADSERGREQQWLIEEALSARTQILKEPLSVNFKTVSEGIWHQELHMAELTLARGQILKTMGRAYAGKFYLMPEEALHLVARGSLVLFYEDIPLSVADAYELMVMERGPEDMDECFVDLMDRQRVYDYLKRLGFIVTRHRYGFTDMPKHAERVLGPWKRKEAPTKEVVVEETEEMEDRLHGLSLESEVEEVTGKVQELAGQTKITDDPRCSPILRNSKYQHMLHVYDQLRVVRELKSHTSPSEQPLVPDLPLQPVFDVYKPQAHFRKREAGEPDFLVMILQFNDKFPDFDQLERLRQKYNGREIQFAVLSAGSLSFCAFK